jgi:hypothetical protein
LTHYNDLKSNFNKAIKFPAPTLKKRALGVCKSFVTR